MHIQQKTILNALQNKQFLISLDNTNNRELHSQVNILLNDRHAIIKMNRITQYEFSYVFCQNLYKTLKYYQKSKTYKYI